MQSWTSVINRTSRAMLMRRRLTHRGWATLSRPKQKRRRTKRCAACDECDQRVGSHPSLAIIALPGQGTLSPTLSRSALLPSGLSLRVEDTAGPREREHFYFFFNSVSIEFTTSSDSGLTFGAKRAATWPSRPI